MSACNSGNGTFLDGAAPTAVGRVDARRISLHSKFPNTQRIPWCISDDIENQVSIISSWSLIGLLASLRFSKSKIRFLKATRNATHHFFHMVSRRSSVSSCSSESGANIAAWECAHLCCNFLYTACASSVFDHSQTITTPSEDWTACSRPWYLSYCCCLNKSFSWSVVGTVPVLRTT